MVENYTGTRGTYSAHMISHKNVTRQNAGPCGSSLSEAVFCT